MIRMNDAKRGDMMISANISLDQSIEENREVKKYRMTYEHAGHIFRALQFLPEALKFVQLTKIDEMRLIPPDKNMRFAEWMYFNSHKLQLFDEEPISIDRYEHYTTLPIDGNYDDIVYICYYRSTT